MRPVVDAWIGLGANLGDARRGLANAASALDEIPGTRLLQRSSLYRTAPIGAEGPDYLNAVVHVQTTLTAPALLSAIQAVERRAGRERPYPNAPRTLDLDLLMYGDAQVDSPTLTLPHPRLAQRAFVLRPLAEIAPDRVAPAWLLAVQDQRAERLAAPRDW